MRVTVRFSLLSKMSRAAARQTPPNPDPTTMAAKPPRFPTRHGCTTQISQSPSPPTKVVVTMGPFG